MKDFRWSLLGLSLSLALAGLTVILGQSLPYAFGLLIVAVALVGATAIWTIWEFTPRILSDPDRPRKEAANIYEKAAKQGGIIHATHVFPVDRDPSKDFAVQKLKDTPSTVELSVHRILLLDSIEDERIWLQNLFAALPESVSKTFYLLTSYPLLLPRIAKALLPRLNLLLYQTPSGHVCQSQIGLDRLHIFGREVNFAVTSRSKRMYRALLNYFEHIKGSGHFRACSSLAEYNATQRMSSQIERGQAVVARIVDFAETTKGIVFAGMFGSMARAALGYVRDPSPERTDADVDLLIIYDARNLDHPKEELRSTIERILDNSRTKVTWGPDLTPFYDFRDEVKVDVDIEFLETGSDFYMANRLLGYSIFRYFMPLYSVDRLPLISYISVPTAPLSLEQRWKRFENDRQGLKYFESQLREPQSTTDPRRLCSHVLRNTVWAMTGTWCPSAQEAADYLETHPGWSDIEIPSQAKLLLLEQTHVVKSDLAARFAQVKALIRAVRNFCACQ